MRFPLLLAAAMALAGCADSHQWTPQQQALAPVLRTQKFYVSTPTDGAYGDHTYNGSGRNTAQIIQASLARQVRAARIGIQTDDFDQALAAAQQADQDLLIFPSILHWEDRATEWSMLPDRVEVKIEVIQVATGDALSSAIIKGRSGLATFGGDHPQDLLPEPVDEFVKALFEGPTYGR
ncbi:DUF4823 domain-containing protein [Pseudomonas sp. DTU_2021_1001937_2_SI_NGA_ILE_001]|uniref:DUF4823 domain-containing protein n=1 Tax=Pseudomonas sp. DTU_2021_1001937_2_SI_NGA_ILE_001 TaxID=3077589 RepID=UPI0028FC1597|nr:DUF4823 domain-containing protein [Pseudomonas sp. DTU_2021_1001937_2_SI_NGA_ILE_001]WNW13636.1 DUF4823 domain-containing protein [Pseudomonas sp. DTU_2021_1001937_2_SI_NGA_ILE_001]